MPSRPSRAVLLLLYVVTPSGRKSSSGRPDGKWIIIPYDLDNEMGGDPNASFYNGEENDRSARKCCDPWNMVARWNVLFDSLIKAYRKELDAKLLMLDATVLAPAAVAKVIDDVVATSGYNQDEARAAPAGTACGNDYMTTANGMKSWAMARHNALVQQIKP